MARTLSEHRSSAFAKLGRHARPVATPRKNRSFIHLAKPAVVNWLSSSLGGACAIIVIVTEQPNNPSEDKPTSENISHQPVAARVPEKVARGIFCTGQVILDSPKEFVIDFLQGLTRPYQVVSRVVLTPQTVVELADALGKNVEAYTRNFGAPAPVPGPPPKNRPTLAEIYENFRLPDELLSGTYANSVMIGHSPTEFFMDFISGFYPTSAVAARIFMPAQQIPRFHTALTSSLENHRQRFRKPNE